MSLIALICNFVFLYYNILHFYLTKLNNRSVTKFTFYLKYIRILITLFPEYTYIIRIYLKKKINFVAERFLNIDYMITNTLLKNVLFDLSGSSNLYYYMDMDI